MHEVCAQCGFDGARYDAPALLAEIRSLGPRWRALVGDAADDLRMRPAPEVWSAIEYATHSRDVTALHAFGVEQALTIEEPIFPAARDDFVQSAAATYDEAGPTEVVNALEIHAQRLAQLAEDAGEATWARGLTLGDHRREVRLLLEHALHDSVHHLDDVERGLTQVRASQPRA